jgi:hypothetical protein
MEYGGVSLENQDLAKALEEEICEGSAQVHAGMAKVARASAMFDEIGGWCDGGIRSFSHWLTISSGFGTHTSSELLRVGHALKTLPKIAEAFAAGRISFDKVRYITLVASPATEQITGDPAKKSRHRSRGELGPKLEHPVVVPARPQPAQTEVLIGAFRGIDGGDTPLTPSSEWGGARMDFDYAVSVYANACEFAEARAGP